MKLAEKGSQLNCVSMQEAVGYPTIACESQTPVEHALVLKHNRYFLITNPHGDIEPPGQCALGLFCEDTRILSHYRLRFRGGAPSLLSSDMLRSYSSQIDLAIKDLEFGGNSWDPKNAIHIRREFVLDDRLMERLVLTNYLCQEISYWVELAVGCDFADIFEVRGWKRPQRGQFFAPEANERQIQFAYQSLDGLLVRSVIQFREPPSELHAHGARWEMKLAPNARFQTEWEIFQTQESPPEPHFAIPFQTDDRRRGMEELYSGWHNECSRWHSNLGEFERTLQRAVDDLRALYIDSDGEPVISAGIPWYSTAFGRDSIITSLETLCLNPRIAKETLRYLAHHQGTRVDRATDEQPGKIMHEIRRGEMARNGEIPHVPYYGTIDATPLWLVLLHETWCWTGDEDLIRGLLPCAERALDWIFTYGDIDGDGFLEYASSSPRGLANQGWKDSGDGVPFPDATLPEPPIALIEVQGYVYDALSRMADLFQTFGEPDRATNLRKRAANLRSEIVRHFWIEDLGVFALALDGRKRPIPTITSNAGHLLWSGVPSPHEADQMAGHLLSAEMFSGWGIRTLSSAHRVFNPMSYHNGSVWPHDNALIVLGLARYGLGRAAVPVVRGLTDAALHSDFLRLPELFCGMPRSYGMRPVFYPVSCSPQAWASGAFFMLLQAVLGIQAAAPQKLLQIRNPILPDFLDELTISGMAVGKSKVSLQFRRHRDRTMTNLLAVSGEPLQVRIEMN